MQVIDRPPVNPPIESPEARQTSRVTARDELDRFRQLRRLSVALFETLDQTAVVERALDGALALLQAGSASFWAAADGGFVCQLAAGTGREELTGGRLPAEHMLADDSSGLAASAPLSIGGTVVGALRVSRAGSPEPDPFTDQDREVLGDLADSVAAAIHATIRAESASANQDLALVLEMSRQIGSSLDLDRVLRTVVNLATKAVEFDRGAVALYDAGKCDIRAVAGTDTVDPKLPELQDLAVRAAWAVGVGQRFYLSDRTEPATDAERIFIQIFGEDLESAKVGSGFYLPLKDDEGAVGILVFEAERVDFATAAEQELLTILANQTTVAIRNAQLYARVPLADTLSAFNQKRRELFALPRRRRWLAATVAALAIGALTLIQWPFRVAAIAPTFRPTSRAEVRAAIPGIVEQVLVREGTAVTRGAPVARLRDTEIRAERDATAAAVVAAERGAALAASRRDPTGERLQRLRVESLRQELSVEDEHLALLTLRSPVSGVVLTARPEEKVGAKLEAGEALVFVGRTDSLELEFGVAQRDIDRVKPDALVRLRVDAFPQRTFVGRVSVLGRLAIADRSEPAWPVRAIVPNENGALKPGMVADARVLTEPMSALGRLLRTPVRLIRLFWWRAWSWS
jgi:GAF domain-containing protein/biotin carboxyl carrier protein